MKKKHSWHKSEKEAKGLSTFLFFFSTFLPFTFVLYFLTPAYMSLGNTTTTVWTVKKNYWKEIWEPKTLSITTSLAVFAF